MKQKKTILKPLLAILTFFCCFDTYLVKHVEGKKAYQLTDDNFEHDTQATTGATTGDWLVLFCETE